MSMNGTAEDVLDFWFGTEEGVSPMPRWFQASAEFDEEIRRRFGDAVQAAIDGGLRDWEDDIRSRLALILLLDQFPRNIHRRTAQAFAGDERALSLARRTVREGGLEKLAPFERMFLLMPYQHAEDLDVQREGLREFEALAAIGSETERSVLESAAEYARRHHDIIARFGRFPYRNGVLNRKSTDEEKAWLESGAERFGQ